MAEYNDYNSTLTAQEIESTLLGAVVHNKAMVLTEAEKAQARENIGAGSSNSGLTILGYFTTYEELEAAVTTPGAGHAYGVGEAYPYDIYIWDTLRSVWINNGNIRGADGADAVITAESVAAGLGYIPANIFTITGTLLTSEWTTESDYSSITLNVTDILTTDKFFLDANMEGITSIEDMASIKEAMGTFLRAACDTDGVLYVMATETPSVDIPFKILCIRK